MKFKYKYSYLMVIIFVLITILSTNNQSAANKYTLEGNGTEESPYLLSKPSDFYQIKTNPKAHYKLNNDIDFNHAKEFALPEFEGVLDGNHHILKNLNIIGDISEPSGDWNIALFKFFNNATVKDLILDNFTTSADTPELAILVSSANDSTFDNITIRNSKIQYEGVSSIGAICATGENITATNCHVINTSIIGSGYIGGLFGELKLSALINCTSEAGEVTGYWEVGGIVGQTNNVSLLQCHSTSNVTGGDSEVGGLVGSAMGNLFISECSVNADVSAKTMVGGLVGLNQSELDDYVMIRDSYYAGTITCTNTDSLAGGLASSQIDLIKDSYVASIIHAGTKYGLAVSGHVQNSYYNGETSGIEGTHARSTNEMSQKSNYKYWNFNKTWKIEDGKAYPSLIKQANPEITPVSKIMFELNDVAIAPKRDFYTKASIYPYDATFRSIYYTCDNPDIIAAYSGLSIVYLYSNSPGTAVVTASSQDNTITADINVTIKDADINLKTFSIIAEKQTITVGEKLTLTAQPDPINATFQYPVWSIDYGYRTISLDKKGNVIGLAPGQATIKLHSFQSNNKYDSITINVVEPEIPITGIEILSNKTTLEIDETLDLSAVYLPTETLPLGVEWFSFSPDIVSVDAGGKVTGLKEGPATIRARTFDGAIETSIFLVVTPKGGVEPEPERELKVILEPGEQIRLSLDDDILENEKVNWSSSAPSVASVDSGGMITAHEAGNAVITATSEDGSYTERIRILVINNAKDYRLAVDLSVGKTCRLTFDENTGTDNITWTSSDPLVATVTNKGKVQALSKGLTIVTAVDESGNEEQVYIRVRE